ncbi:hypothetical protein BS78_08G105000 [Paspalum vaginatum]|nr:hypothetical protein BS78_08G105000 [Paspalum vaginatum]
MRCKLESSQLYLFINVLVDINARCGMRWMPRQGPAKHSSSLACPLEQAPSSSRNSISECWKIYNSMDFGLAYIKRITDDFSEEREIGGGGYGKVYRAEHEGREIAVKKLHPFQGLDDEEFHSEFNNLVKIHHPNIIELIGYCYESQHRFDEYEGKQVFAKAVERILCFEYMHGGSLQKHIGDEPCSLDWPICYRIIKGICAGLNHLHNAKAKPILHLDLKPGNILLDKNMEPKIADLGSSRLGGFQETQESGTVKGTFKYMPPECKIGGKKVSVKFDVFSLGVITLDMVSGNNGYEQISKMSPKVFIMLVSAKWKGRLPTSSYEIYYQQLKACIEIALRCVKEDPNERPDIKDIVRELEELDAKHRRMLLSSDRPKDPCDDQKSPHKEESGPSHQPIPETATRAVETEAPKETAENCFGEVVDNSKLDELARYAGKPKTQEDRARLAWALITDGDKKGMATRYVDVLKAMYGNGQSTLCLVYNATGDTLHYVASHDWYGYIGSRVGYPAEIGNGQWAAFHHVHRQGEPSGSVGAVVYRGKKKDGQPQDYMLAWSTPWGFYYRNKAYVETGGVNYFQKRWEEVYVKLVNSDYSSYFKSGGCHIEAQIEKGDSPKYAATIKAEHGP